jgi:hypothetical protein
MYQLPKYFDRSNYNSYDEQKGDLLRGIRENDPYPENLDLKQLWEENKELDIFSAMENIGFNMGLMGLISQADSPLTPQIINAYAKFRDTLIEYVENSSSSGNKEADDIYVQLANKFYSELNLMLSEHYDTQERLDERIAVNELLLDELKNNDGSLLDSHKLVQGVVVLKM